MYIVWDDFLEQKFKLDLIDIEKRTACQSDWCELDFVSVFFFYTLNSHTAMHTRDALLYNVFLQYNINYYHSNKNGYIRKEIMKKVSKPRSCWITIYNSGITSDGEISNSRPLFILYKISNAKAL